MRQGAEKRGLFDGALRFRVVVEGRGAFMRYMGISMGFPTVGWLFLAGAEGELLCVCVCVCLFCVKVLLPPLVAAYVGTEDLAVVATARPQPSSCKP